MCILACLSGCLRWCVVLVVYLTEVMENNWTATFRVQFLITLSYDFHLNIWWAQMIRFWSVINFSVSPRSLYDRWGRGFGHVTDLSVCASHGLWVSDLTSVVRWSVVSRWGAGADGWRGMDTRLLCWAAGGSTTNSLTSTSSSGHLLMIRHTCYTHTHTHVLLCPTHT